MEKEISCVIVDDEEKNAIVLHRMIDQFCPTVEILGTANSVEQAVVIIEQTQPDIVFLDIEMPEEDGFQLFNKIPNPNFCVVFTTAHAQYALKAIKYAAMDYLLKPINLTELRMAIENIITKKNANENTIEELKTKLNVLNSNNKDRKFEFEKIALKNKKEIEMFNLKDIIWCEAQKAHTLFHMKDGREILVSELLKEYENLLPSSIFNRVHKSHIVNLTYVNKFINNESGGHLLLQDGTQLEVAVRRKKELLSLLNGG